MRSGFSPLEVKLNKILSFLYLRSPILNLFVSLRNQGALHFMPHKLYVNYRWRKVDIHRETRARSIIRMKQQEETVLY